MPLSRIPLALLFGLGFLQEPLPPQEPVDPALRAAVERFFATQEAEDIDASLALWSTRASRPRPEMLKYVFDAGDDRFSDIQVTRVMPLGERVRVRVSVTRERTSVPAGGFPRTRAEGRVAGGGARGRAGRDQASRGRAAPSRWAGWLLIGSR